MGDTGRFGRLPILASDGPPHRLSTPLRGAVGQAVDGRRNLAALWFAELTAIFGFSFAFPFPPLFLRELGIHTPSALALWRGVAAGASGFSLAVMSPVWGALADRYGRRSMLIRAMVGGAVT